MRSKYSSAGEARHPGTLQQLPVALSSTGSQRRRNEDWVDKAVVRVEIMPATSRETFQARTINPEVHSVLRTRGPLAVTAKDRIRIWDGRLYEVIGVRTADGAAPEHSRDLLLDCVESGRSD